MSTLIALKLNDTTVLATDSLLYDLQQRAVSRTQQKIHEVAPGLFYAWSGRKALAIQQANIAVTLSRIARPINLCAFAEELNAASLACIEQEANYSLTERGQPTVSGELPFFIYILAGVSEGVPGFLVCEFTLNSGEVKREMTGYFEPTTCGSYVTGDKSLIPIMNNPKSWEGGLSKAAERFVDHLRLVQPTYVNGPIQMACIDKSGARWVHEPVELHREGTVDRGSGGVQAKLLSGSPLSTDTSGNLIVKQGAGVGTDGSGNLVVKTDGATIGINGSNQVIIPALGVQTANLAAGSLGDLTKYSSTVRAVTITFGYPGLPNSAYPAGAMIMNTSDGKVYRTSDGYTWNTKTSPVDMFAGQFAAGVVYAGTVAAANVVAGSLYGFTITGSTMQLNLYGVTTTLGNIYDSGISSYVGIKVSDNSSTGYSSMSAHGVWQTDNAGNTGQLANGILALHASSAYTNVSPYFLQISGLPSYNPGTGTKQFWYDPSDGDRVKFAA